MFQKSYDNSATVYLIPTPIGNLDDITLRAVKTLKNVDVIFCEDTRVTGQLLAHLEISKKMFSSHEYNENQNIERMLNFLKEGKDIGIVSDRGTPVISDPGYSLVKAALENHYNVVGLPGATALIPALITSGLDPMPFYFYGFLNHKKSQRIKELKKLENMDSTLIFYEAPHRINDTLDDIAECLGNDRKISISREITKKYEEIYRGTVKDLVDQNIEFKGELVIVLEGNKKTENYDNISIYEHINMYIKDGMKTMEAIKEVARERNMKKSDVYNEYHIRESEK